MNPRHLSLVVMLSLPIVTTDVLAGDGSPRPSARPAWEWSDGERLAALMDDSAAAARLKADRDSQARNRLAIEAQSRDGRRIGTDVDTVDVIDGRRDPHLFFPYELFQQLITVAYAEDPLVRSTYRESKDDARRVLGLPDDMWHRLEAIASAYRAAQLRNSEFARQAANRSGVSDPTSVLFCAERYKALLEAEAAFGPAFTHFLYTAVAPDIYRRYMQRPDARLLKVAKGVCQ